MIINIIKTFVLLISIFIFLSCDNSEKPNNTIDTDNPFADDNFSNSYCFDMGRGKNEISEFIIHSENKQWAYAVASVNLYKEPIFNMQIFVFNKDIYRYNHNHKYEYVFIYNTYMKNNIVFVSKIDSLCLKAEYFELKGRTVLSVFSHKIENLHGICYLITVLTKDDKDEVFSNTFMYSIENEDFSLFSNTKSIAGLSDYHSFVKEFNNKYQNENLNGVQENMLDNNINNPYINIFHFVGKNLIVNPVLQVTETRHNRICYEQKHDNYLNWYFSDFEIEFSAIDNVYRVGNEIKFENYFNTEINSIGFRKLNTSSNYGIEMCAVLNSDICSKSDYGVDFLEVFCLGGKDSVVSVFRYKNDEVLNEEFYDEILVVISKTNENNHYYTNLYYTSCGATGCCGIVEWLIDNSDSLFKNIKTYEDFNEQFPKILTNS
jgi:hypothetical protein